MDVAGPHNTPVTTAFPLRDTVKPWRPGAYVLVASATKLGKKDDDTEYDYSRYEPSVATQTVYDTDIGLTTFRGADGLTVIARSFETAKPLPGVALTLIATDNDELGRATTDAEGKAAFPAGLLRGTGATVPAAVIAY